MATLRLSCDHSLRPKPTIVHLPIEELVPAPWNWKKEGEGERIEKFIKSIERDRSAGVLAVRELGKNRYEVIDGNHRLTALKQLKWKEVPCENFGPLSLAEAMTTARRRNFDWFDDDVLKYAKAFGNIVQEIPIQELAAFMPETEDELQTLAHFTEFSWEQQEGVSEQGEKTKFVVTVKLLSEDHKAWLGLLEHYYEGAGIEDPAQVFMDLVRKRLKQLNGKGKSHDKR
jgi:hypothetical protein